MIKNFVSFVDVILIHLSFKTLYLWMLAICYLPGDNHYKIPYKCCFDVENSLAAWSMHDKWYKFIGLMRNWGCQDRIMNYDECESCI